MVSDLDHIRRRLSREKGTWVGYGARSVALAYPSPYPVGMSSLGYQAMYGLINSLEDTVAERVFLPDDEKRQGPPLLTYEGLRPAGDLPVIAFSVAYELELAGVFTCLTRMGIPLLAKDRQPHHPFILMGGPLTFSNPVPLGPFADAIVMGEGEDVVPVVLDVIFGAASRVECLEELSVLSGLYVPVLHGEWMPPVAQADDSQLPAASFITTPESALSNMFLIEIERGCSRACSFCVMRRSTNGGMRLVSMERVLDKIPEDVQRVGLVGAAVSDHPRVTDIVKSLVAQGKEVSLSSLRADRLSLEFVEALYQGGYRTLTVASDGASEDLRKSLLKKIRKKHLLQAARLAGEVGMKQLKVYMMVGAPGEREGDIDELIEFSREQAELCGPKTRLVLGIAPFVAKRNTPLDGTEFLGIKETEKRLRKLRQALRPQVDVRPTSARWAWVEYQLAQGGFAHGLAALAAWQEGGRFADYKRVFTKIEVVKNKGSKKLRVISPKVA
jgi:radical SAM superfamily enzyme YgiQ (UPF0313 family)